MDNIKPPLDMKVYIVSLNTFLHFWEANSWSELDNFLKGILGWPLKWISTKLKNFPGESGVKA